MKPYNERLPLIDAAIDELGGDLSKCHFYSLEHHTILWKGVGQDLFLLVHPMFVNALGRSSMYICTCEEFNQRAKELGYINGYKYGVEYETNGERPDLPDDVVIECFDGVEWWGGYNYLSDTNLTPKELGFDGSVTEKFRIVDERYKPKGQDMNNDWYDKGELPPVGAVCEYHHPRHGWKPVEIIGIHIGRLAFAMWGIDDSASADYQYGACDKTGLFRPLPTETDRLVDEAELDIRSLSPELDRQVIRKMIDAGYRKIKPMSEGEFVTQAFFITTDGDRYAQKLYRAGCRFISGG